jgi:hypothetical protein
MLSGGSTGFADAGLSYRRRAAGHDADGTVVDALTKIDRDTIILKRRAGPAPIKFPKPLIGPRIFEVPNSHRYCDHKIVMTSSGASCLAGAGVGRHGTDILQLPAEFDIIP